jgi:hypothetical protein
VQQLDPTSSPDPTVLVSVSASGTGGGNADSRNPVFGSNDVVVYESDASDLGATDTNGTTDIYQRNLAAPATTLVSANAAGAAGNGPSTWPVHDFGGTYYFQSDASDLVPTDTNGTTDIFQRERSITRLVSVNTAGNDSGNGASTMPGRIVDWGFAFNSEATDLGPTDTNGAPDVYVAGGAILLVSTNATQRDSGNGASRVWAPRGDPARDSLLFESEATDLGPSVGGSTQIYLAEPTFADLQLTGMGFHEQPSEEGISLHLE